MTHMNETTQSTEKQSPIILHELPSMPALLGKAALKSGNYQPGDALPGLSNLVKGLKINPQHLHDYQQLCGFQRTDNIPATYLHMLAFPLFLQILIQQDFPIKAMGMVHLRNQISLHEAFDINETIDMTAAVGSSHLSARGLEWNVDFKALVDNQLVLSGQSTFLHRCATDIKRQPYTQINRNGEPQIWTVAADTGRRYARISGDYNPIHLTDITAKLLGFKRAIAHGMWSKARCLAALESQLPEAGYRVDVTFHRPLFLPSSVLFYSQQVEDKQAFSLFNRSASQAHLEGFIT